MISAEGDSESVSAPAVGPTFGERTGPTVRRIALGAQLRKYRVAANVTAEQAGHAIRGSHSKISRLECGRGTPRVRDVTDLLDLYGVIGERERENMLALARQATQRGWWHPYQDILPHWLEFYIGLEEAASEIRTYEVQFIHGLLQTEDYARAVIRITNAHTDDKEISRRVNVRMERQRLLTHPDRPTVWAVLDEAALRRPPDGTAVMRGQLRRLLDLTDLPNVTLQIVPFRKGPHAAAGGPFTILRFPWPDVRDVVYLEQLNSATYIDEPGPVMDYLTVMHQLVTQAAQPGESKDMLRDMLKET